jgi:hypothetical protein
VVSIRTDAGTIGTGTFINANGDVLTASHVVFNRFFTSSAERQPVTNIQALPNIYVYTSGLEPHHVMIAPTTEDAQRAASDIAIIKTGIRASCYLKLGDPNSVPVGSHLIAMGYPSYGQNLTLYEGFLSSRLQRGQYPIGRVGEEPVYSHDEALRVQMPVSAGTSGAALITDTDSVIGVLTDLPMAWPDELQAAIERLKLAQVVQSSYPPGAPNPVLAGQDLTAARLALIFREFASPGTGLAVPVSYLETQTGSAHKP